MYSLFDADSGRAGGRERAAAMAVSGPNLVAASGRFPMAADTGALQSGTGGKGAHILMDRLLRILGDPIDYGRPAPPWSARPRIDRVVVLAVWTCGLAAGLFVLWLAIAEAVSARESVRSPARVAAVVMAVSAGTLLLRSGRRRGRREGYQPNLAPIPIVVALWLSAATLLGLGINQYLRSHSQFVGSASQLDVFRVTLTLLGATGVVFAGVYAYRKQRLEEGSQRRSDAENFSEQFARVSEQLGNASETVRMAGFLSLAQLADAWPTRRQLCIDLYCASFRAMNRGPTAEVVLRDLVVSNIASRLTSVEGAASWCGYRIDLSGVELDGLDLRRMVLSEGTELLIDATTVTGRVDLRGARFTGGRLSIADASIDTLDLSASTVYGGQIQIRESSIRALDWQHSQFYAGYVRIWQTSFRDYLWFTSCTFAGGKISVGGSVFADVDFGTAYFTGADLELRGRFLTVDDARAQFAAAHWSISDDAHWEGDRLVWREGSLTVGAHFDDTEFRRGEVLIDLGRGECVDLCRAKFQGTKVRFPGNDRWVTPPKVDWGDVVPRGVDAKEWNALVERTKESQPEDSE